MGSASRYAVLFGFSLHDRDRTGYVKAGPSGCSVTEDESDATKFRLAPDGEGSPKDWCKFFRDEPELSSWRFHPVIMSQLSE